MAADAMLSETVKITGHGGDPIEAYAARLTEGGPRGGMVVIHHMPGYDEATKEIARRFAVDGYDAICPNLYWREAPGAAPDDAAATARAPGRRPGRAAGRRRRGRRRRGCRALPSSNGKVATIGYCSGGRQSWLANGSAADLDAAIVCYGAFIVGQVPERHAGSTGRSRAWLRRMSGPVLGMFGNDDSYPTPGAGRRDRGTAQGARQAVRVPSLRRRRARVLLGRPAVVPAGGCGRRLGEDLGLPRDATWRPEDVHLPDRDCSRSPGSGKGPAELAAGHRRQRVRRPPGARDGGHTLNIDLRNPAQGPSARVALELHPAAARSLAEAILRSLDAVPRLAELTRIDSVAPLA